MNINKKTSRIFKFLLSLTMALSICIGSFADINQVLKVSAAAAKVATITIHADPVGTVGSSCSSFTIETGCHAFISIKNISSDYIYVLGVPVKQNEAITIGTFGNQKSKYGPGIYTNLEAYKIKYRGAYKSRVSLSRKITKNQLDTVQNTMKRFNKHSAVDNCAVFAAVAWDSIATDDIWMAGATPKALAYYIKSCKGWKKAAQIGTCDKTDIRRILPNNYYMKVNKKDIV